jgi:two-component system sensor histidine kinase GlrK
MSHELKTPLANIREGTELLLDGTVGQLDSPQREVTDILRMNGLKLQQLIENLLSFSAWQTKTEVLTLSDFPVHDLVISVAKAQRLALKAANIQLKLEIDELTVNADREKIRTVLDNLLSNAIKFTPRGGLITVRAFATKR